MAVADYTVASAKHAELTKDTVDTVVLTNLSSKIQVVNRASSGTIYFTLDGSEPTVGGDNAYAVFAGEVFTTGVNARGRWTVKLISSTEGDAYSVQAVE